MSPIRDPNEGALVEDDPRQLACDTLIYDDDFIASLEFMSFLYRIKGKSIKENVDEVNTSNERQLSVTLENEVAQEMDLMTPKKGRKLLKDVNVLIFPGWDMNSALIFNNFFHDVGAKHKLSPEGVTQVYMGSLYNPDKHAMQIWSLYPPRKILWLLIPRRPSGTL